MFVSQVLVRYRLPCGLVLVLASPSCVLDWHSDAGDSAIDAGDIDQDEGSTPDDMGGEDASDSASIRGADHDASTEPTAPDAETPIESSCKQSCGDHEICEPESETCQCDRDRGYYFKDGECVFDQCSTGPCGANEMCQRIPAGGYACPCASGFKDCSGSCVNLNADRAHCGTCNFACAGSLECVQGACRQAVGKLVLGHTTTCAVPESPSGRLRCWGDGAAELYLDGSANSSVPREVPGVETARVIALARGYRCVVPAAEDVIKCWGFCGAECSGSSSPRRATVLRENPVDSAQDIAVIGLLSALGAGALIEMGVFPTIGATCTLSNSGVLRCMGLAPLVPALVDMAAFHAVSVVGEDAPRFRDVSGDGNHFCGTLTTGAVACWGLLNQWSQLGTAEQPTEPAAVQVQRSEGGALVDVVYTSAGLDRSCSVTSAGDVYCWGNNTYGMLGVGNENAYTGAVKVSGMPKATIVAVGGSHTCALAMNGELYCWGPVPLTGVGADAMGDMNGGTYFSTPQRVPSLQGVLDVSAGGAHTCVRLRTGAVMCWGLNDHGQIGDNTYETRYTPVLIEALLR